ncbi:MAG: 4'-phosphopantetheinyl transferase superfamily protein [Lachnospiraceae bacterium]|nr:4'-phosphopantetheinyl transferase superfamily protein [Lachnospiraceae bacterium]
MLSVRWRPVGKVSHIPSFGEAFYRHLFSYRNPDVFRASATAWNLLEELLEEQGLGTGLAAFTDNGKPYFEDMTDLYFSLSHSGTVAAAALADVPVGLDVEKIRESYRESLINRCLSPEEKAVYDGDFTRVWCRKEALAKLSGEGIFVSPVNINTLSEEALFREEIIEDAGQAYRLTAVTLQSTDRSLKGTGEMKGE